MAAVSRERLIDKIVMGNRSFTDSGFFMIKRVTPPDDRILGTFGAQSGINESETQSEPPDTHL